MKNQFMFIITVFLGVILVMSSGYSQNLLRIDDDIGGGGGGSTNQDSGSDNTALYVVAGLAVAGAAAAYYLYQKAGPAPAGVMQGSPLSPLLANIYLNPEVTRVTQ